MVCCSQLLLFGLREYASLEQSLIWRMCNVIDLMYLSPMHGLIHQLHYWLEEIDVETGKIIDAIESFQCRPGAISIAAYKPSYRWPLFLLHKKAIVLLVRARVRKCNSFLVAVVIKILVDEFTAII